MRTWAMISSALASSLSRLHRFSASCFPFLFGYTVQKSGKREAVGCTVLLGFCSSLLFSSLGNGCSVTSSLPYALPFPLVLALCWATLFAVSALSFAVFPL